MSFMASALKRNKDLTLPSVEAGLGTLNITKDPPKSVYTRKIDKVGENMDIVEMIDASSDRNSQGINLYARGVNPMVTVSYANYGNNGGMQSINRSGKAQASLPYKVMDNGAFRPPLISPQELLPLSRQPRLVTQALTNPSAVNYTKKVLCPESSQMRQVKNETLQRANIRPSAVYNIERSVQDVKPENFVVESPIKISGYSGTKTIDNQTARHLNMTRGLKEDVRIVVATTNPGTFTKSKKIDATIQTDRYLQNTNVKAINTNPKLKGDKNKYVRNHVDLKKNVPVHNVTSNPRKNIDKNKYCLENVNLSRNIPEYNVVSNPRRNIDKNKYTADNIELSRNVPQYTLISNPGGAMGMGSDVYSNTSRSSKLKPKIKAECPEPTQVHTRGMMLGDVRKNEEVKINQGECKRRKDIYSMQVSRYS